MRATTTTVCQACRRALLQQTSTTTCTRSASTLSSPQVARQWRRPRPTPRPVSRRNFLNVFNKPPREVRSPEIEPGFEALLQIKQKLDENVRLPSREYLIATWRTFFRSKTRSSRSANPLQVAYALDLYTHLLETKPAAEDIVTALDLPGALYVLLRPPAGSTRFHIRLVKDIYKQIEDQRIARADNIITAEDRRLFEAYTRARAQYGAAHRIYRSIVKFLGGPEATTLLPEHSEENYELWRIALQGHALEKDAGQLEKLVSKLSAEGFPYTAKVHEIMTGFYAKAGMWSELNRWFVKDIADSQLPTAQAYRTLFSLLRQKKMSPDWVTQTMRTLTSSNPSKELWDVVLQWAVFRRKSMDEIQGLLEAMNQLAGAGRIAEPDVETVNWLMRTAIDNEDYFQAERLKGLLRNLGLQPNARTYALELECRQAAGDVHGADESFKKLLSGEQLEESSYAIINNFIRHLCSDPQQSSRVILDFLSIVENRRVLLEPKTVASICVFFLKHDLQFDVIDTLSIHVFHFDLNERDVVLQALMSYCTARADTSTARAWDCYNLLKQYFPEMDRDDRTKLMDSFFLRKRSDMAAQIFGHMRASDDHGARPNEETYVRCLEGIGHYPDNESMHMIHNMFKMDALIQPSTRLYTAFMIAYTGCGNADAAYAFWQDAANSPEGPTHQTLAAVFKCCQIKPFGFEEAGKIWNKLVSMDVEIPANVYWAYVVCLATHGMMEDVKGLITGLKGAIGVDPLAIPFGKTFNAIQTPDLQKDFEDWAKEAYPNLWNKLKAQGVRTLPWGVRKFQLKSARQTA